MRCFRKFKDCSSWKLEKNTADSKIFFTENLFIIVKIMKTKVSFGIFVSTFDIQKLIHVVYEFDYFLINIRYAIIT